MRTSPGRPGARPEPSEGMIDDRLLPPPLDDSEHRDADSDSELEGHLGAVTLTGQQVGARHLGDHRALFGEFPANLRIVIPFVSKHVTVLDNPGIQPEPYSAGPAVRASLENLGGLHACPLGVSGKISDHAHDDLPRQRDHDARSGLVRHPRSVPPAPPRQSRRWSPLEYMRNAGSTEVTDVHALCVADPDLPGKRLMHVAKQDISRLCPPDRIKQGLAAPLHPPGHGVEEQLRHGGRDMRAQHVYLPDSLDLRGVDVIIQLVRGPVNRAEPAADESECPAAELDPLPVEHVLTGPQVLPPQPRYVDVAVGQV